MARLTKQDILVELVLIQDELKSRIEDGNEVIDAVEKLGENDMSLLEYEGYIQGLEEGKKRIDELLGKINNNS